MSGLMNLFYKKYFYFAFWIYFLSFFQATNLILAITILSIYWNAWLGISSFFRSSNSLFPYVLAALQAFIIIFLFKFSFIFISSFSAMGMYYLFWLIFPPFKCRALFNGSMFFVSSLELSFGHWSIWWDGCPIAYCLRFISPRCEGWEGKWKKSEMKRELRPNNSNVWISYES